MCFLVLRSVSARSRSAKSLVLRRNLWDLPSQILPTLRAPRPLPLRRTRKHTAILFSPIPSSSFYCSTSHRLGIMVVIRRRRPAFSSGTYSFYRNEFSEEKTKYKIIQKKQRSLGIPDTIYKARSSNKSTSISFFCNLIVSVVFIRYLVNCRVRTQSRSSASQTRSLKALSVGCNGYQVMSSTAGTHPSLQAPATKI